MLINHNSELVLSRLKLQMWPHLKHNLDCTGLLDKKWGKYISVSFAKPCN